MKIEDIKNNWAKILIVVLSGTLVGDLTNVWDLGAIREDGYIKKYTKCIENQVLAERKLQGQINTLNSRLLRLEIVTNDFPFPLWVKEKDGTIVKISDSYEKFILIPLGFTKEQVINTKGEILGLEFVKTILENDDLVVKSKRARRFRETIPNFGNGTSYKYPYFGPTGEVWGTSGTWIPDDIETFFD